MLATALFWSLTKLTKPLIMGAAKIGPLPVAPVAAVWEVNTEAKTSTSTFLGGTATITRRADTGKFHGDFSIPLPDPEPAEGEAVDEEMLGKHEYRVSQPLHHADTLYEAQVQMETCIREHLSKSHPELLEAVKAAELQEALAAAGPDPF